MNNWIRQLTMLFWVFIGIGQVARAQELSNGGSTTIRFATFNCSLNRNAAHQLIDDLSSQDNRQAKQVAEVLQTIRPDVVLLNEFDFDSDKQAATLFCKNYLAVPQGDSQAINYPFVYSAPVNTGVDSGFDLNGDGKKNGPDDGFGFGRHPGQYGMVVLSKFPIDESNVRTFQKFKWADMPNGLWPIDPVTSKPFYNDDIKGVFRLSSKSHWDVPITIDGQSIHFLVCHPTPPVFDGIEDRNGARNHDEIRFWADYIDEKMSAYIYDDQGNKGGLPAGSLFVIAGDMNADPQDGDNRDNVILQVLDSPLIADPKPTSKGAVEAARTQSKKNAEHKGDAAMDTSDFDDRSVGNLRIDYVLPSRTLTVEGAGVFWPDSSEPNSRLSTASDHHPVWVEVKIK